VVTFVDEEAVACWFGAGTLFPSQVGVADRDASSSRVKNILALDWWLVAVAGNDVDPMRSCMVIDRSFRKCGRAS
jgi:hypothetical protein